MFNEVSCQSSSYYHNLDSSNNPLNSLLSTRAKVLLGVRLLQMQTTMDHIYSKDEVDKVLEISSLFPNEILLTPSSPASILGTVVSFMLPDSSSKYSNMISGDRYKHPVVKQLAACSKSEPQLRMKIFTLLERAKDETEALVLRLRNFDSEYEQERHLIQAFIAYNMDNPLKKRIAIKHFFEDLDDHDENLWQISMQYLCVLLLPGYFFALVMYIFMTGVFLGGSKTNKFLLILVQLVFQEIFILKPMKLWMKWVMISSLTSAEIRSFHGILRERAKVILTRKSGIVTNFNCIIQHFNPACRAARCYPHLSASRLLVCLNDDDLPINEVQRPASLYEMFEKLCCLMVVSLALILNSFPMVIQEIVNDANITAAMSAIIGVSYYLVIINVILIPVIFIGVFILFYLREKYIARLTRMGSTAMQPVKIPKMSRREQAELSARHGAYVAARKVFRRSSLLQRRNGDKIPGETSKKSE